MVMLLIIVLIKIGPNILVEFLKKLFENFLLIV